MSVPRYLHSVLVGASALLFTGAQLVPDHQENGPVLTAAIDFVSGPSSLHAAENWRSRSAVSAEISTAVSAFATVVRPLSRPHALEAAFRGYFAYKAAHPGEVRKPFLYFVDYGLPSSTARGYVFDMASLTIVDGPFTVAHGRGSSPSRDGVPTRFSNVSGSAATSLGLYVAQATYAFRGKTAGYGYRSIGLRLKGISSTFNDNAMARGVVAHGAPYVTADKAGRSEGCPAMESERAEWLLPKLANGGMVFLFAPDEDWMARDPWLAAGTG